jgi:SnoaL-like domain
MPRPTVEELLDRIEIQDLLTRYTHQHDVLAARFAAGLADGTEFDVFDEIFTPDAVIDFTRSGGHRDLVGNIKAWMAGAYALFPVQHHLYGQIHFSFSADGREAETRAWAINPMGYGKAGEAPEVFTTGGYFIDRFVRTSDGWRISEHSYDPQWQMGDTPAGLEQAVADIEPATL